MHNFNRITFVLPWIFLIVVCKCCVILHARRKSWWLAIRLCSITSRETGTKIRGWNTRRGNSMQRSLIISNNWSKAWYSILDLFSSNGIVATRCENYEQRIEATFEDMLTFEDMCVWWRSVKSFNRWNERRNKGGVTEIGSMYNNDF